jgi:hypothetical protein
VEWLANTQANLDRLTTTANTVQTLGQFASLASPTGWVIDPYGNAQLTNAIGTSISTSFQNDPWKASGNALATVGTFLIPGGETAVVGDVAKTAEVLQDASKVVETANQVTPFVQDASNLLGAADDLTPVAQDFTTFYHGTSPEAAQAIRANGIDLSVGNQTADFGQGFYMTTSPEQAMWSGSRAVPKGQLPDLVEFQVPNDQLNQLSSLNFESADADWENFVNFNKNVGPSDFVPPDQPYDMVSGPLFRKTSSGVTLPWEGNVPGTSAPFAPQTSIHTQNAVDLFNSFIVP